MSDIYHSTKREIQSVWTHIRSCCSCGVLHATWHMIFGSLTASKTTLHCVSTPVFQEALPTVYQKWNSLGRWLPEAWLLPRTSYLSASTVWRFQNLNQLTRFRWHSCICLLMMWDPWLCISDNRRRKGNPARNEKNAYLVAPIRVPKSRSDAKPATHNLSNFDNSSTPSSELVNEQREQQS